MKEGSQCHRVKLNAVKLKCETLNILPFSCSGVAPSFLGLSFPGHAAPRFPARISSHFSQALKYAAFGGISFKNLFKEVNQVIFNKRRGGRVCTATETGKHLSSPPRLNWNRELVNRPWPSVALISEKIYRHS